MRAFGSAPCLQECFHQFKFALLYAAHPMPFVVYRRRHAVRAVHFCFPGPDGPVQRGIPRTIVIRIGTSLEQFDGDINVTSWAAT